MKASERGRAGTRSPASESTDLDEVVATLTERGVAFEEYDLPDLKTENGIATVGDVRAAWCRDPDGNILAVESVGVG